MHMLRGMAIPGDSAGKEDVEGASSDGYSIPPDFMPTLSPPPFTGKTRKKRKTREAFYKGYGVVYLPGDIKGLQINCIYYRQSSSRVTPQSRTSWFTCWVHY